MNRSRMIQVVAALVFCALLPATALAQQAVSRPFEMRASSQMVVNPTSGVYEAEGSGVATHCGFITFVGTGLFILMGGHGTITAANGDEIWFNDQKRPVEITGGTGRFENASGSFAIQLTSNPVIEVGVGTMTISYTWTASGRITY